MLNLVSALIRAAWQAEQDAYNKRRAVVASVQESCEHESVGEAPEANSLSGMMTPAPGFRVCLHCGVHESLRHDKTEYTELNRALRTLPISRDAGFHIRAMVAQ